MLRRNRREANEEGDDINVTPLLDIVFIMLIFFIVTATFIKEPGVEVNRPAATTAEAQKLVSVLIAITPNNQVWINNQEVPVEGVRVIVTRLRRENPKGGAVIQVDSAADSHVLLKVLQQVRDSGVASVAVSARRS